MQSVGVAGGFYAVLLGSESELTAGVFGGSTRYVDVIVGDDQEMRPMK